MTSITGIQSSNTRVIVATLLVELNEGQDLVQEDVDAAINATKNVFLNMGYSVKGNSSVVAFQRVRFDENQKARVDVSANVVVEDVVDNSSNGGQDEIVEDIDE